jgi:mono/diheme cytochrome c family protein
VEFTHSLAGISDQGREELNKIIAVISAEAELTSQVELDAMLDEGSKEEAIDLFFGGIDGISKSCGECHGFDGDESEAARTPNLTGWGSRDWTIRFTKNPEHADFYGSGNDRMPVFEEERIFTDRQIELVVDWLRGDWVRFNGGSESAESE